MDTCTDCQPPCIRAMLPYHFQVRDAFLPALYTTILTHRNVSDPALILYSNATADPDLQGAAILSTVLRNRSALEQWMCGYLSPKAFCREEASGKDSNKSISSPYVG